MLKNATAANPDLSDWVFTNLIAQYNDEVVTPEVTQPASMNNAFTGSGLPQNYTCVIVELKVFPQSLPDNLR